MDINNIQALIAQGLLTDVASVDPNTAYVAVGVYQPGNRQSGSGNNTYPSYAMPISEFLAAGGIYTASNGIALVGNDFQLASLNISQFTNDAGYLTSAATNDLDPVISQTNIVPGSPTLGDRYLAGTAPAAPWTANSIEEWDGASWITTAPVLDDVVFVTATLSTLRYNGTAWVAYAGTAVLNQGNTTGSALVIGTNTAQALVFKTFNTESARITSAGSWGFGTITPGGKVHIKGQDSTSSNYALKVDSLTLPILYARNDQKVSIGSSTLDAALRIQRNDLTKPALIIGNATGTDNFHYVNSVPGSYAWLDMLNGNMTTTSNYRILHVISNNGVTETYYNGSANVRMKFSTESVNNRIETYDNSSNALFSIDSVSGQSLFQTANVGIGLSGYTSTAKLHIVGVDTTSTNYALKVDNLTSPLLYVRNDGIVSIGKTLQIQRYNYSVTKAFWMEANSIEDTEMNTLNADLVFKTKYVSGSNVESIRFTKEGIIKVADTNYISIGAYNITTDKYGYLSSASNTTSGVGLKFEVCQPSNTTGFIAMQIENTGNVGIGITPTAKLHVKGIDATFSNYVLKLDNSASMPLLHVRNDGHIFMNSLPTSNAGLSTGELYISTAATILANGDKVVGWKV